MSTAEAVTAALAVWWTGRAEQHPSHRARMRAALEAALPHLTDTGVPSAPSTEVDAAYQRGWTSGHAALEVLEREQAVEAFRRGVEIGRAEQEARDLQRIDGILTETGPTDYEVWRDALKIAAISEGPGHSPQTLMANAEWFHDRLKAGPPAPPEPDCFHCGADSSMDHDDHCPNADDGLRADEEPTDDEVDCVRCGAPPGGHPDGCPTIAPALRPDTVEYR